MVIIAKPFNLNLTFTSSPNIDFKVSGGSAIGELSSKQRTFSSDDFKTLVTFQAKGGGYGTSADTYTVSTKIMVDRIEVEPPDANRVDEEFNDGRNFSISAEEEYLKSETTIIEIPKYVVTIKKKWCSCKNIR